MKFTLNLMCLSLPFVFLSCQKTEYKYYKIYPELKDWFCNYHVGSYWVYQNSISGQIDTVRLTYHIDTIYVSIHDNIQITSNHCAISSTESSSLNGYGFSIYPLNENINNISIGIGDFRIGHEIHGSINYNSTNFSPYIDSLPVTKLDSYSVEQKNYLNILKLKGRLDYLKSGNTVGSSTIYIAKNIGLIQFTKLDTIFNLISYEIN